MNSAVGPSQKRKRTIMYLHTVAHVNMLAAHRCDSIMANSNSDHDDSDVELKIVIVYIQLCIEYVQKYYMISNVH